MSNISNLHFCGLKPSECMYRIPINMEAHDKMVYEQGRSDAMDDAKVILKNEREKIINCLPKCHDANYHCVFIGNKKKNKGEEYIN